MRILDEKAQVIIRQIKEILLDANNLIKDQRADGKDIDLIKDLLIQIDGLFMIVIAGEYNSGKSAFINALLGDHYLKIGITPTTSDIHVLQYGEKRETIKIQPGQTIEKIPVKLLQDVSIVDTPGTNAVLREHEVLTNEYIPRSDLVLFITSVDRPFSESEKIFLERIRDWGKKIVFIINKVDILESEENLLEIKEYISDNVKSLLGMQAIIFSASAKKSLDFKLHNNRSDSSIEVIENFISSTLGSDDYISLKLSSPLGVIENMTNKYLRIVQNHTDLLDVDVQLLDDIQKQLALFREDMLNQFRFRYAEIDNTLLEFEKNGLKFFEDTFRFARIMDLLNKDRIQYEYQDKVTKDLNHKIDSNINALIDWLVGEDLKQWQTITHKIDERSSQYSERIMEDQSFRQIKFERQKIIDAVNLGSQKVIDQFDKDDEAQKIAEEAQMTVAASVAIEVGALGMGAIVTILATTASADLTGVLLAGVTAALGLFIIPAKKKNIKTVFSNKIFDVRKQLSEILTMEFEAQLDKVVNHIQETIAPYNRFIRSEIDRLSTARSNIDQIQKNIYLSRQEITNIFGK